MCNKAVSSNIHSKLPPIFKFDMKNQKILNAPRKGGTLSDVQQQYRFSVHSTVNVDCPPDQNLVIPGKISEWILCRS
jgi:hypothetical protein